MENLARIIDEITPHGFMGDADYITATQLIEEKPDLTKILGVDAFDSLKRASYETAKMLKTRLDEKGIIINNAEEAWLFSQDILRENMFLSLWKKLTPYAQKDTFIVNMLTSFSIHNKFKILVEFPISSDVFFQHIDINLNLEIANGYKKHLPVNKQTYYDCLSDKQKIVYLFNEIHELLFKSYLIKSIVKYVDK